MSPAPLIKMTRTIPGTSLVGVTKDGTLIDLDGAQCEWHPSQQLQAAWGDSPVRVSDDYPQTFVLRFSKAPGDLWIKWFEENPEVRFAVWKVTFWIDSMEGGMGELAGHTCYTATGYLSS